MVLKLPKTRAGEQILPAWSIHPYTNNQYTAAMLTISTTLSYALGNCCRDAYCIYFENDVRLCNGCIVFECQKHCLEDVQVEPVVGAYVNQSRSCFFNNKDLKKIQCLH